MVFKITHFIVLFFTYFIIMHMYCILFVITSPTTFFNPNAKLWLQKSVSVHVFVYIFSRSLWSLQDWLWMESVTKNVLYDYPFPTSNCCAVVTMVWTSSWTSAHTVFGSSCTTNKHVLYYGLSEIATQFL